MTFERIKKTPLVNIDDSKIYCCCCIIFRYMTTKVTKKIFQKKIMCVTLY